MAPDRGETEHPDVERVKADWRWQRGTYWLNPQEPAPGWQAEKYVGMVKVTRNAWNGLDDLDQFIDGLRKAAEGLTDPEMLLLSGDDPEEPPYVYVQGWRPITALDRERLDAVAAHTAEQEREQYEVLRAKFEAAEIASSEVDRG